MPFQTFFCNYFFLDYKGDISIKYSLSVEYCHWIFTCMDMTLAGKHNNLGLQPCPCFGVMIIEAAWWDNGLLIKTLLGEWFLRNVSFVSSKSDRNCTFPAAVQWAVSCGQAQVSQWCDWWSPLQLASSVSRLWLWGMYVADARLDTVESRYQAIQYSNILHKWLQDFQTHLIDWYQYFSGKWFHVIVTEPTDDK